AKPSAERRARRAARGQALVPPIAVVSGSLGLDPSSAFFTEAVTRPLVLTTELARSTAGPRLSRLAEVAEVVVTGSTTVEPVQAMSALAERGLIRVLCEGGPTLAGALATADVIDELCLSVSPVLVGPAQSRILSVSTDPPGTRTGFGSAEKPWPLRMELYQVLCAESMLLTCYRRTSQGDTAGRTTARGAG
ncbi:MAG: dihydrofolate reductase family protein, partial [Acidimicrobiales bacterium]